ncbi:unnamed protein product [Laminaria digitata]
MIWLRDEVKELEARAAHQDDTDVASEETHAAAAARVAEAQTLLADAWKQAEQAALSWAGRAAASKEVSAATAAAKKAAVEAAVGAGAGAGGAAVVPSPSLYLQAGGPAETADLLSGRQQQTIPNESAAGGERVAALLRLYLLVSAATSSSSSSSAAAATGKTFTASRELL